MTAQVSARVGAIIVAAGSGQRFGDRGKVLHPIAGKPMIDYSLELFCSMPEVVHVVVVAGAHSISGVRTRAEQYTRCRVDVCLGGETRRDSVIAGFEKVRDSVDLVAVHDAARPLASRELVYQVLQATSQAGAAVPVLQVSDTIYRVDANGLVVDVEPREHLRAAQTPQVARTTWLQAALESPATFTDEGSALRACGYTVATVPGSSSNLKITFPDDVRHAESLIESLAVR